MAYHGSRAQYDLPSGRSAAAQLCAALALPIAHHGLLRQRLSTRVAASEGVGDPARQARLEQEVRTVRSARGSYQAGLAKGLAQHLLPAVDGEEVRVSRGAHQPRLERPGVSQRELGRGPCRAHHAPRPRHSGEVEQARE
eukprot:scaffold6987_cov75-Phaeocystis_antarctica.AAC.3